MGRREDIIYLDRENELSKLRREMRKHAASCWKCNYFWRCWKYRYLNNNYLDFEETVIEALLKTLET